MATVSSINICFWIWTWQYLKRKKSNQFQSSQIVVWLSLVYVFVCAFRSFLPRADVQRICLFDTWFSNVLVGRSLATLAELCFVAQWAIVLNQLSKLTGLSKIEKISKLIIPLIFIAECFSWYAVIRMHYLGNTFEESLWAITYILIAAALIMLLPKAKGAFQYAILFSIVGTLLYVAFMLTVDVPMYFARWQAGAESGQRLFGFSEGLNNLNSRWIVTHEIEQWKTEIPWMSLYFSVAVWTSLALCYVNFSKDQLTKYLNSNSFYLSDRHDRHRGDQALKISESLLLILHFHLFAF